MNIDLLKSLARVNYKMHLITGEVNYLYEALDIVCMLRCFEINDSTRTMEFNLAA